MFWKSCALLAALLLGGAHTAFGQGAEPLLQGSIISSGDEESASRAFDGDISTCYSAGSPDFQWVGLDLGKPHVITRIAFTPRQGSPTGADRMLLSLF